MLASLGLAWGQYPSADAARQAEPTQILASDIAVREIAGALGPAERQRLRDRLPIEAQADERTLVQRIQASPTDVKARTDLLLRRAVPLEPRRDP